MTYDPGLDVHPGDDDTGGGTPGGVDTPDPFGPADQPEYDTDSSTDGPDLAVEYLPPWSYIRAPGTRRTVIAGEIVPVDPWHPVIAMLNADQLALLNRESAARQAANYWVDDVRNV
jgi:hypothetical protein